MKTKLFNIALLLIFMIGIAQAQEPRSKEDRIRAVKVAFITEELDLTPKQSEGFWPLYNEMHKKMRALKKDGKGKPDIDAMSDAELETWLDNHLKIEEQKIAVQRSYIQKFKNVISIRQVAKLSRAEHRFKRELLNRAKERREGGEGKEGHRGRHH